MNRTKSQLLRDQTIVGNNLTFGPGVRDVLGPNLVLRDCSLTLNRKSQWTSHPAGVRKERCHIVARTTLKGNSFWTDSYLEDCRFSGAF